MFMSKRKHRYTNVLAYINFWDARGVSSLVNYTSVPLQVMIK